MSEQHQVTVESLVDFPKDVGKPFLAVTGGQWPWIPPALCLDPLRPPHPIPPSPVLTTKSWARKRPPIFFVGIPNRTSVSQAYEHPVEGFDQIPKAFVDMMDGASQGKVIVRM